VESEVSKTEINLPTIVLCICGVHGRIYFKHGSTSIDLHSAEDALIEIDRAYARMQIDYCDIRKLYAEATDLLPKRVGWKEYPTVEKYLGYVNMFRHCPHKLADVKTPAYYIIDCPHSTRVPFRRNE
jgi:hypothetical protein